MNALRILVSGLSSHSSAAAPQVSTDPSQQFISATEDLRDYLQGEGKTKQPRFGKSPKKDERAQHKRTLLDACVSMLGSVGTSGKIPPQAIIKFREQFTQYIQHYKGQRLGTGKRATISGKCETLKQCANNVERIQHIQHIQQTLAQQSKDVAEGNKSMSLLAKPENSGSESFYAKKAQQSFEKASLCASNLLTSDSANAAKHGIEYKFHAQQAGICRSVAIAHDCIQGTDICSIMDRVADDTGDDGTEVDATKAVTHLEQAEKTVEELVELARDNPKHIQTATRNYQALAKAYMLLAQKDPDNKVTYTDKATACLRKAEKYQLVVITKVLPSEIDDTPSVQRVQQAKKAAESLAIQAETSQHSMELFPDQKEMYARQAMTRFQQAENLFEKAARMAQSFSRSGTPSTHQMQHAKQAGHLAEQAATIAEQKATIARDPREQTERHLRASIRYFERGAKIAQDLLKHNPHNSKVLAYGRLCSDNAIRVTSSLQRIDREAHHAPSAV